MEILATNFLSIINLAEPLLRQFTEHESSVSIKQGGWSRKEVLGHLIDSASNNHQRFVRAALQNSLEFPAYDQNRCVRVQSPATASWGARVGLGFV